MSEVVLKRRRKIRPPKPPENWINLFLYFAYGVFVARLVAEPSTVEFNTEKVVKMIQFCFLAFAFFFGVSGLKYIRNIKRGIKRNPVTNYTLAYVLSMILGMVVTTILQYGKVNFVSTIPIIVAFSFTKIIFHFIVKKF